MTHYLTPRKLERVRFTPMSKADALAPPFPPEARRITERCSFIHECQDEKVLKTILKAGDFFQDRVVKEAQLRLAQLTAAARAREPETPTDPSTDKKTGKKSRSKKAT